MTDREKLIELIENAENQRSAIILCCTVDEVIDVPGRTEYIADHLLAHGVTIREPGEWVDQSFVLNGGRVHCFTCSKCGSDKNYTSNYCPNCGAPMKGESNEH